MHASLPVSLQDKLRFLAEPASHADRPAKVEQHETHLSYVFLTPTYAYKMKKPVENGAADLRTLAAREANCRAELALNRRLAPDVYLAVVAMTQRADGTLELGGAGRAVEWLVQMRRLPAAAMMDAMILHGTLTPAHVDQLARRLVAFYVEQPGVTVTFDAAVATLRREIDTALRVLADPHVALDAAAAAGLHRCLVGHLEHGADFAARVAAHRIVEGHGDLRPEHVCFTDPLVVFDCLEFNRALRLVDPFDEIAYLTLECDRLGAPWVGPRLRHAVAIGLGDDPPLRLSAFYTTLRAFIRARLAAAHLLERDPRTPENWRPRAADYLACATRACTALG